MLSPAVTDHEHIDAGRATVEECAERGQQPNRGPSKDARGADVVEQRGAKALVNPGRGSNRAPARAP